MELNEQTFQMKPVVWLEHASKFSTHFYQLLRYAVSYKMLHNFSFFFSTCVVQLQFIFCDNSHSVKSEKY